MQRAGGTQRGGSREGDQEQAVVSAVSKLVEFREDDHLVHVSILVAELLNDLKCAENARTTLR